MKTLGVIWPDVADEFAGIDVMALVTDSREVRRGMLFMAVKGLQVDGRKFIPDAIAAGAVAIMADQDDDWASDAVVSGVPIIVIPQLQQEIGPIAARFHGHPSAKMHVLAVTGTNGKTSVANMLAAALTRLGEKAAVLGTIGNGFFGDLEKSTHTTSDACSLQGMLAGFSSAGAHAVALEASSHGLEQGRLAGTAIEVALFTNLTRDHLDYHGDMESYASAKEKLFRWPGLRAAVINADDPSAERYINALASEVRMLRYSQDITSGAEIVAISVKPTLQGLSLVMGLPEGDITVDVPLLGRFNVSNLLAVAGGLVALGLPRTDIAAALRALKPVPGRMESFVGEHPTIVVDYAHTPDALEKVLSSLREHAGARLVCVFGCGGDRDRGKRPMMGAVATRLADVVVITSDNPRSESAAVIADEICAGIGAKPVTVQLDRRLAIRDAVHQAGRADIVLIAGKGHEDYQEAGGVRSPFSDTQEVAAALAGWVAS